MRHRTNTDHRFVELDELTCAGCGDRAANGPDGFTHDDATPMCASVSGAGEAAGPAEVAR